MTSEQSASSAQVKLTRTLLGARGLSNEDCARLTAELLSMPGVEKVSAGADAQGAAQIEVHYDAGTLTVMDLIRKLRVHGILAGML